MQSVFGSSSRLRIYLVLIHCLVFKASDIFHTEAAHYPTSVWFVFTLQCSWTAEISSMKLSIVPSSNQKHFQFVFFCTNQCPFSCEESRLSNHLPIFVWIRLRSFPSVFLWALYNMDVCNKSSGIGKHSIWRARSDFSIATWCLEAPKSVMCCTAELGWCDALHVQKSVFSLQRRNKQACCMHNVSAKLYILFLLLAISLLSCICRFVAFLSITTATSLHYIAIIGKGCKWMPVFYLH